VRHWFAAIALSFLLASLIAARPRTTAPQAGALSSETLGDIVFVSAARLSTVSTVPHFPEGSSIMRLSTSNGRAPVDLTPEFFAAADPQVSFDGKRILFSAQKARGGLWQVWEMGNDGSGKHQITTCRGNCFRPAYLPVGDIVYTTATEQDGHWACNLAVSAMDGSQERVITFGPGDYELETVLNDGRVLASASSPLRSEANHTSSRSLYTLRPDGSGLELLRPDLGDNAFSADADELDDAFCAFIRTQASGDAFGGQLEFLQQGRKHALPAAPVASMCRSPRRFNENQFIMACAVPAGSSEPPKFDLYLSGIATPGFTRKIYADARKSSFQAAAFAPRERPKILWSTLRPDARAGYFVALNSYHSADFPDGRLPGRIERIRVVLLDRNSREEKILGDASVETDGSFYIAVPADQPVRFELLDRDGTVIQAQKSWIWSRGGEQRACIGCHEDKALAPDNHWPLALKRFDSPIQIGVKDVPPLAPE
jgi:Hydrazine synthase alpha subunit middle domain